MTTPSQICNCKILCVRHLRQVRSLETHLILRNNCGNSYPSGIFFHKLFSDSCWRSQANTHLLAVLIRSIAVSSVQKKGQQCCRVCINTPMHVLQFPDMQSMPLRLHIYIGVYIQSQIGRLHANNIQSSFQVNF